MLLVPTESNHKDLQAALTHLKELQVTFKVMSVDQARLMEPGLAPGLPAHCMIHFPNDEIANSRQFAILLRTAASKLKVQFNFNAEVRDLHCSPRPTLEIAGWSERPSFDALVLCTGTDTLRWARLIQLRLPAASIYGYSISAAIREPLHAPRSALVTLDTGVVFTRQGQRVRVSGGAEIGKPGQDHDSKTIQKLFGALQHHFPGSTDLRSGYQSWRGARMFVPDGMPLVGPSPTPGVWLNTGHGANGAALASGCARLLADQISGEPTDFNASPLRPNRFGV
jgi:D-amino-acid dehydrogenase